jgi:hypothetical protein
MIDIILQILIVLIIRNILELIFRNSKKRSAQTIVKFYKIVSAIICRGDIGGMFSLDVGMTHFSKLFGFSFIVFIKLNDLTDEISNQTIIYADILLFLFI